MTTTETQLLRSSTSQLLLSYSSPLVALVMVSPLILTTTSLRRKHGKLNVDYLNPTKLSDDRFEQSRGAHSEVQRQIPDEVTTLNSSNFFCLKRELPNTFFPTTEKMKKYPNTMARSPQYPILILRRVSTFKYCYIYNAHQTFTARSNTRFPKTELVNNPPLQNMLLTAA